MKKKHFFLWIFLLLLVLAVVFTLLFILRRPEEKVSVLLYHRFNDSRYPSTSVDSAELENQILFLKSRGVSFLSENDFISLLEGKKKYGNSVLISIDDGFRSILTAYPVLKKYSIPFIVYINTGYVGIGEYLNWNEISELNNEGLACFGLHSSMHTNYSLMLLKEGIDKTIDFFSNDIIQTQKIFEEKLGKKAVSYAYPYGYYIPQMEKALFENNIKFALLADKLSHPYTPHNSPYHIPRIMFSKDLHNLSDEYLQQFLEKNVFKVNSFSPVDVQAGKKFRIKLESAVKPLSPKINITLEGSSNTFELSCRADGRVIVSEENLTLYDKGARVQIVFKDFLNFEYEFIWHIRPFKN
ncbi:MAG TPA: polysaccharide deacetylase family protein [Petrotogaceae bacterium]|nr:polysaccharide deacetylase family protein [Petrotogaceae bacterium]